MLTTQDLQWYSECASKEVERRNSYHTAADRTRKTCGFFAPGFCIEAGRATDTRPARGRSPLVCVRVSNLPATLPDARRNVSGEAFKSHTGAFAMSQSVQVAHGAISLSVIDGIPTATSNEVAQHFGKQHSHVLRAIEALLEQLPDAIQSNFGRVEYTDAKGESRPAYRLTRDGFTLLAMGFTGKKALQFKLAYIEAFNRMERELAARAQRPVAQIEQQTINYAQAQHLKELVHQVVRATGRSHAEVWSRLHNRLRVNSYLKLLTSQFDEACTYLNAKLTVPQPTSPAPQQARGESLEQTLARLTAQVAMSNAYPVFPFLPLLEAINRRIATDAGRRGFQA